MSELNRGWREEMSVPNDMAVMRERSWTNPTRQILALCSACHEEAHTGDHNDNQNGNADCVVKVA
jgi:cytochrome c553